MFFQHNWTQSGPKCFWLPGYISISQIQEMHQHYFHSHNLKITLLSKHSSAMTISVPWIFGVLSHTTSAILASHQEESTKDSSVLCVTHSQAMIPQVLSQLQKVEACYSQPHLFIALLWSPWKQVMILEAERRRSRGLQELLGASGTEQNKC